MEGNDLGKVEKNEKIERERENNDIHNSLLMELKLPCDFHI